VNSRAFEQHVREETDGDNSEGCYSETVDAETQTNEETASEKEEINLIEFSDQEEPFPIYEEIIFEERNNSPEEEHHKEMADINAVVNAVGQLTMALNNQNA